MVSDEGGGSVSSGNCCCGDVVGSGCSSNS